MRLKKLLSIIFVLIFLSGVSAVFADPWPENGEPQEEIRTTVFYRGQEYLPEELTVDQMKEALGWYIPKNSGMMSSFAVPVSANPLRSGAGKSSFTVDNYGEDIAKRIDALRHRLVSDVQGVVKINGYGTYNNNNSVNFWPFPKVTDVGKYYEAMGRELGLRVKVVRPADHPNIMEQSGGDPNGIAYIIMEVGPEDAEECIMILTHMDTVWDSLRIDYESSLGIVNKAVNDRWSLGGLLSAKEIIDPTTGRSVIVGRGTDDDKVSAIPEMYALKALKESGIPLKRKVQLLLGTNEENGGNRGAYSFSRLETYPKVSYVADVSDGTLRLTQNAMWYARGVLSWDNPGNDDITLRFPAVLVRDEYALTGTSNDLGPDYYTRWKATYDAYHIGSNVGSTQPAESGSAGWGLQLKTAAWLVCDDGATAANLYSNAMAIRNTVMEKYWTYIDNQNYYKPFIKKQNNLDEPPEGFVNPRIGPDGTPEGGRWDIGLDIKLISSPGSAVLDTVQIIARGMNWRYTEQFGQNSRHILMDFLANLTLPFGKTARWHDAVKRIQTVFPYGQAAAGKDTWRAAHLFDAIGVQAYFNEFTPSLTTSAGNRNLSISSTSWDIDFNSNIASPTRPNARVVNYVGNNTEDVGQLYFELRFLYPMAPYDDDWFKPSTQANNRDYLPTVQAEKVRAAMAAAGIGSTTIATANTRTSTTVSSNGINSYNQVSGNGAGLNSTTAFAVPNYYTSFTHDSVQFALRATDAYYQANDIPWRETLCGQNGTNYGVVFRVGGSTSSGDTTGIYEPPKAGTAVGLSGWGGKNGLHAYNERVEPDGLIGFANRVAMVMGDAAYGRHHTYSVRGNGNRNSRMVLRLENLELPATYNATSSNTYDALLKEDVYINEAWELPDVMTSLRMKGLLPAQNAEGKTVDFLFGRKFLMKDITDADGGALELTVKVGAAENSKAKQHLLVVGELANGMGWDVVNNNTDDVLQTVARIAPGSKFDAAVASPDVVNTRLITFLITETSDTDTGSDDRWDWLWEEIGCNAGVSFLAVLALAGLIPSLIRRKR